MIDFSDELYDQFYQGEEDVEHFEPLQKRVRRMEEDNQEVIVIIDEE